MKLQVLNYSIDMKSINDEDYVSLTDLAKYVDKKDTYLIINNWMRRTSTIEFLGLWEKLNNPDFKPAEIDRFKNESGGNTFRLPPQTWIKKTNAIGIISKSGRYGGTFAHVDIALEFASWMSPEFRLYIMTEFRRLKEAESKQCDWDLKRTLSKINYNIHTSAIKNKLIPNFITEEQKNKIYREEADIINVALFGMTAKEWKIKNPQKEGNMRDYANVAELVCLVNLENLNSVYINEGIIQSDRLVWLNKVAIEQMKLLIIDKRLNHMEEDLMK